MLAAPSKTNLPAHSRDVCPWTGTCPVHALANPTFADLKPTKALDARRLKRATLRKPKTTRRACFHCNADRPEGRQLKMGGRSLSVCQACYDNRAALFGVGRHRFLSRTYRQSIGVAA